jgi:anaerobic ribonucleoside-triphosphate reductase
MSDITIKRAENAKDQITLSDDERQPCEVWTRVMGYHRPVSSFNRGKQGEYAERTCFAEPDGVAV